jgi:hypothetical protein
VWRSPCQSNSFDIPARSHAFLKAAVLQWSKGRPRVGTARGLTGAVSSRGSASAPSRETPQKVDLHTGEVSWKGRLRSESDKRYERELVEHGQKWWPVKKYEQAFMRVGSSSQWKLVVDGLVRAGSKFPDEGVPFSVLLTIEGSREESDVFRELRQELLAGGVTIADVRTANRISTRV